MSIPFDPNDPGGGGDPPDPPPPAALPGLGVFLRPRYTSNLVISDEIKGIDLLYDVLLPASRMIITQAPSGQLRFKNKKPVDWALGTEAFAIGDTAFDVDNASPWISDQRYHLLIDPFTNDSEIRDVTDANYSLAQNSVSLTSSAPAQIVITGFSGSNGNNTPATAVITVSGFTADTAYTVTLDGVEITFTPRSSDSTVTIASFLAGAFRGHPHLNRRFRFSWVSGASVVNITALFGTLIVDTGLGKSHVAPVANPATAPTLTAAAGGSLAAGIYRVSYTERNEHGETLPSPFKSITLTANQKITVSAVVPTVPGNTIVWYTVPEANSDDLRYHSENSGASFEITTLPRLKAPYPPDVNRTGTEVMRVKAVFSDRPEVRGNIGRSNVLKATYEWDLGDREDTVNRIDLVYRESGQDYRLIELRIPNEEHIAKVGKVQSKFLNGSAIDNGFQAFRIGHGELAERRDADFFYKWGSTREALLLEEADVVVIIDGGSGVINLPVMIEEITPDLSTAGLPKVSFAARLFANWLYDDSVVKRAITIVSEPVVDAGPVLQPEPPFSPSDLTGLVQWLKADAITGLANNDPVATWEDSSSANKDGTQSTSGSRPIYKTNIVSGLPVVRFDGTDDYLNMGNHSALTECEMFIVMKLVNDPPSALSKSGLFEFGGATTGLYPYSADGIIYDDFASLSRHTTVNPADSMAAWCVYNVTSAATEWTNRLNGTQLYTTGTNTVWVNPSCVLGRTAGVGAYFEGDVAEFILYNRKLTTDERAEVLAHLESKYGL